MHNACLSTFCGSNTKKSFVIDTPSDYKENELSSELMKIIRKEMSNIEFSDKQVKSILHFDDANENLISIPEFYKKLQFTIFTVFNIRKQADNPPNQVYIDINEIKKIMENSDTLGTKIGKVVNKLETVKDKIGQTDNHVLEDAFNGEYKCVINGECQTAKVVYDNEDDSSVPFTFTNSNVSNDSEALQRKKKSIYKIIEAIDKHNAITTLGTIIFTDNMSKFNTVNTICDIPANNSGLEFGQSAKTIEPWKDITDDTKIFKSTIRYKKSDNNSDKYDKIYFNPGQGVGDAKDFRARG